jgi:predicted Na+-dependent transporter
MAELLEFAIAIAVINGLVTAAVAYFALIHVAPRLKSIEMYYGLFIVALIVINSLDYLLSTSIAPVFGVNEQQKEFPIVIITIQSAAMALFMLLEYVVPQLRQINIVTSVLTMAVIPYVYAVYNAQRFDLRISDATSMLWFV